MKALKLTGNIINDEGAAYIAQALSTNQVLETLWLGRNNLTDTGVAELMEGLRANSQTNLKELR